MEKCGEIVVSKKQLLNNLTEIKKIISNRDICAMVKANAYGHGIEHIYNILRNHVKIFGVANINEALKLKEMDKSTNVLIVGKTYSFKKCIENNISFTIESFSQFENLVKTIKHENFKNYCINIHIKVNSGMNRLGVSSIKEFKEICKICDELRINIEGVCTHFATADCDSKFYKQQIKNFEKFLLEIPKRCQPIIHVGGSGVLIQELKGNKANFDMLRVGIALYGYSKIIKVKPVLSVKSKLIKVFYVKEGEKIGYSNGFTALKNMRVGIVPLGYGDGIPRSLSNKATVLINKKKCKIIGHICMDMFFVDLTNVDAFEGEEVVVLNDVKKWAKILGTIPYEILTNLSLIR